MGSEMSKALLENIKETVTGEEPVRRRVVAKKAYDGSHFADISKSAREACIAALPYLEQVYQGPGIGMSIPADEGPNMRR